MRCVGWVCGKQNERKDGEEEEWEKKGENIWKEVVAHGGNVKCARYVIWPLTKEVYPGH